MKRLSLLLILLLLSSTARGDTFAENWDDPIGDLTRTPAQDGDSVPAGLFPYLDVVEANYTMDEDLLLTAYIRMNGDIPSALTDSSMEFIKYHFFLTSRYNCFIDCAQQDYSVIVIVNDTGAAIDQSRSSSQFNSLELLGDTIKLSAVLPGDRLIPIHRSEDAAEYHYGINSMLRLSNRTEISDTASLEYHTEAEGSEFTIRLDYLFYAVIGGVTMALVPKYLKNQKNRLE